MALHIIKDIGLWLIVWLVVALLLAFCLALLADLSCIVTAFSGGRC